MILNFIDAICNLWKQGRGGEGSWGGKRELGREREAQKQQSKVKLGGWWVGGMRRLP